MTYPPPQPPPGWGPPPYWSAQPYWQPQPTPPPRQSHDGNLAFRVIAATLSILAGASMLASDLWEFIPNAYVADWGIDYIPWIFDCLVSGTAILGGALLLARKRAGTVLGTITCGFILYHGIVSTEPGFTDRPVFLAWIMAVVAIPTAVLMNIPPTKASAPLQPGTRRPGLAFSLAIVVLIGALVDEVLWFMFARISPIAYLLPLIPIAGAVLMLLRQSIGIAIAAFGAGAPLYMAVQEAIPRSIAILIVGLVCIALFGFLTLLAHLGVERALTTPPQRPPMPPPYPPQPYMRPYPQQPHGWQQPPWPPR